MSTRHEASADAVAPVGGPSRRRAAVAVLAVDSRLLWVGATMLTLAVAGLSAVVVVQYAATFSDPQQARSLQLLAGNPAIRVLFGVPRALDTAGGFTVWRTGTFAAVAAAVWGLLAATRLTRGEEDAGRTPLLLAGPLTLSWLQAQRLSLLLAAQAALAATLHLALTVSGAGGPGAAVYAAGVGLVGMFYTAVGALCGQLASYRHTATELAVATLAAGLLARMVADGLDALVWLSWLTPFGLVTTSAPYAGDDLLPLAVLYAGAMVVAVAAVVLARRRDVGAGVLPLRPSRPGRLLLLGSMPAFAARRSLSALRGWTLGLCAYCGLIGLLSVSLTEFLAANPRFAELATAAGFSQLTTVQGYVASLFFLLPIPLGIFAASQLAADVADEDRGRLTLILSRPVARHHWALTRVAVIVAACSVLAVLAGTATYLGALAAGAPLALGEAVSGCVNALPAALLALAAAQLAVGWAPRAVEAVGAVPVVGGFVLWTLAGTFNWPHWVATLTPFAHLGSVPASPADMAGALGMLTLSGLLILTGVAGFMRRDLRG